MESPGRWSEEWPEYGFVDLVGRTNFYTDSRREYFVAIKTIGIVVAGIMGSGIAQVFSIAGVNVTLNDINEVALQNGLSRISANRQ